MAGDPGIKILLTLMKFANTFPAYKFDKVRFGPTVAETGAAPFVILSDEQSHICYLFRTFI
jgi:hypothetical protein